MLRRHRQASRCRPGWLRRSPSKLRAEALAEFLAAWQAEHLALTAEEMGRAERELRLAAGGTAA
ncbi:MAG TPA: hypothetical protein VMA72_14120 [Streptosporangiaceae bacterium]|nr:hypothetical protein [Streptosporangiaceae bacterium]